MPEQPVLARAILVVSVCVTTVGAKAVGAKAFLAQSQLPMGIDSRAAGLRAKTRVLVETG